MRVFGLDVPTPTNTALRASGGQWRAKIDYLSVTSGEFHVYDPDTGETFPDPVFYAQAACAAAALDPLSQGGSRLWTAASGRSGYRLSAQHSMGARLFWSNASAKPLLEAGGAVCDTLQASGVLLPLVSRNTEGVTRIDLAADLTCDVSPSEFVSAGLSARVGTRGSHASATGETEYIGSPKSDRMCRVYRYAPPHPRADAIRVEIVLRREAAKTAALALCEHLLSDVFWACSSSFGFRHPLWRPPADIIEVRATLPNERTSAGRLRWLETQIRPAVLKAHRDGLIDLHRWISSLDE